MDKILLNFNVSIVIPFYKKVEEFKLSLPKNAPYFQRNGIEVVLVLDEDESQNEVKEIIKQYPFINWIVIVNHTAHKWRNPAKAINVGIRHATKNYIMVCSPESEFETDAIYILRETLDSNSDSYVIGTVGFGMYGDNSKPTQYIPYGSIMAHRDNFLKIRGYDESIGKWGLDDDNLRERLKLIELKEIIVPDVKLIHKEFKPHVEKGGDPLKSQYSTENSMNIYNKIRYPKDSICNDESWGTDFNGVIYDYRSLTYANETLFKYLKKFEKYDISNNPDIFTKKYKRILISNIRNCKKYLKDYIKYTVSKFDGVIVVDDGSDDDTYELFNSSNLILKVKKFHINFNDFENRNIGLDLVSFFFTEWIYFMDGDEFVDERFCDFDSTESRDEVDNVAVSFVDIWDNKDNYNAEYLCSRNGIRTFPRGFRNIGHCQIISSNKLHFQLTPYDNNNVYLGKILIKHYNKHTKELREAKYKLYQKEDTQGDQSSYEHILNHYPRLLNVKDIIFNDVEFKNLKG
jgi:glycosyltransferase involved in cell wall biosynthesis